jgi:hypothetical protein
MFEGESAQLYLPKVNRLADQLRLPAQTSSATVRVSLGLVPCGLQR